MNKTQYLLVKIAEEAAEVGQMALKTAHFGVHEKEHISGLSNVERLRRELTDLIAVVEMLQDNTNFNFVVPTEEKLAKRNKVEHYLKYSQSQGLVDADE